jgi:iron complex outermembrane receptor protein
MAPTSRAAVDERVLGRWLAALLWICLSVPAASAQTPTADTVPVIPINPLTVNVLRGPVGAGREPFPVASLGEVALRQGKTGAFLEEALDGLPGVQVQNRFNYAVGERLSIRGFGPRAQFGVRGVRVLVDGIPATVADGQSALEHIDLGSVGRVEVLRGPASALYGNAGGGVVTFASHAPWEGPFRPEARVVMGSNGLNNLLTSASGTAGSLGYLVSLSRLGYDGFRSNPANRDETYGSAERWGANAQVLQPLAGGRLRVTLNYIDLDAENPGSLSRVLQDSVYRSAFRDNVTRWGAGKTITQGQLGASWLGGLGPTDAEFSTWGISRDLRNPTPLTIIDLDRQAGGARALLRGSPDLGVGLSWGLGGELELQSDDRKNFVNNPGPTGAPGAGTSPGASGNLTLDQHERVLGTGVFALGKIVPVSRLELSAALRYDRFHFEAEDNFPVSATNADDSGDRVMDAISPSAGFFVDVAPAVGLFGSVASALETPTTTELTNRPEGAGGFNPTLEPQEALTIEGGVRGQLAARLGYELSVFHTDVENELVPFEVPQQPGRSFYRNAGASTHKGVEAAVRAALTDELSAQVTWTHVDARFEAFTVGASNFAGNRVPGLAPNHLEGLLRAEWRRWFGDVKVEWVDDVPVNNANEAGTSSPAYTVLDLRAGLDEYLLGGLSLSPFVGVQNVLDEAYNSSVTVNAVGGRYFEPGPARTFHVGLNVAWSR